MTWWHHVVGRARRDRDLAQEIQAHIAERVDDLVDGGMSPEDARRTAVREFGSTARCLEDSRAVWSIAWLASLGQDLRYVLRTLRRQPMFSVGVVLILSCGIGLVTAFFTMFNARVLRVWPVPDVSSIVTVKPLPPSNEPWGTLSAPEYRYFREHARSLSHLAASLAGGGPIGRHDGAMVATVQTQFVTSNYFDALRIGMTMGRGFLPEEEDYRSPRAVAVISERVWREYFGSDPGILERSIRVNDLQATVVGVAEPGFVDVRGLIRVDIWLPLPTVAIAHASTTPSPWLRVFDNPTQSFSSMVFGRLRPGVTVEEAKAELDVLSRQFRQSLGMDAPGVALLDTRPWSTNPIGIRQGLRADLMMFVALLLVMVLACANAGNLTLANTVARRDEIAIRLSLGASRWRVARQLITEVLLLAAIAGVVGLYLAATVPSLYMRLFGSSVTNHDQFRPDAFVFLFTLLMSIVACLVASLGPVLWTTRTAVIGCGKDRALAGPRGHGLRVSLLAMQIALSTVLLFGAGLLTRAITHALSLDPGFDVAGAQEISIELPTSAPRDALSRIRDVLAASGLPSLAFSALPPITTSKMEISVRHPTQKEEHGRRLTQRPVSSSYFGVLGIPIRAGRVFDDRVESRELVVSESAARLLWPAENPIGKRLVTGSAAAPQSQEIVGVVADVVTSTLNQVEPVIYQPVGLSSVVLVRDPSPAGSARVKDLVQSALPGASAHSRPLAEEMRDSLRRLVLGSRIALVLGLLALLLAMLGAFGVFAAMVEERRHEIGVRMALGARGVQVVQLVLRGAIGPVLVGLAAGLALSISAAPLLRHALYGMSPFDPIAYVAVAAVLLASSLAATWIPAARATRVEPAITLRAD